MNVIFFLLKIFLNKKILGPGEEMKSLTFVSGSNYKTTTVFAKAPANSNAIVGSVFVGCVNSANNGKCGDHFNVVLGN